MKTSQLSLAILLFCFSSNAQTYLDTPAIVLPAKNADISLSRHIYTFDNKLIFTASKRDGSTGGEWWSYDGANTLTAAPELTPGSGHGAKTQYSAVYRRFAVILNDTVYFSGTNPTYGNELYKWDGVNTPILVKDLQPGPQDAIVGDFATADNKVYFTADSSTIYRNIFEYNPAKGSVSVIKHDINQMDEIGTHNGKLYYHDSKKARMREYDPLNKQDKIILSGGNFSNFTSYGASLYFTNMSLLQYYDGSTPYAVLTNGSVEIGNNSNIPNHKGQKKLIASNGRIYFWTVSNNICNLYYYDTTSKQVLLAPGLKPFSDIKPSGNGARFFLLEHQNKIYYNDGVMLVRYDGTKADTMLPFNLEVYSMAVLNNDIYLMGKGYGLDTYMLYTLRDTLIPGTPPATIHSVGFDAEVTLYPNPVANTAYLNILSNEAQHISINIVDAVGKIIFMKEMELNNDLETVINLPFDDSPTGVYFVTIKNTSGNLVWSTKVLHE